MIFCRKPAPGYGEGEAIKLKWGFIIPHTPKAQGAMSWDDKYSEFVYASIMLRQMDAYSATRINGIDGAAKELLRLGRNASIEPHFNAFNGFAKGAMILVLKGDTYSKMQAELILDQFAGKFPDRRIRGVKEVWKHDRGYKNLYLAKKHGMQAALLTELFFGDSPSDWLPVEDQANFWTNTVL
jgi:hypothetical protein